MTEETKVRVKLDTTQARTDLRGLTKDAARTASSLGTSITSAVGRGLSLVGAGAAVGAGISAIRSATSSGVSDIFGEGFGLLGAQLNEFALGGLDDESRSAQTARQKLKERFSLQMYREGKMPEAGVRMFEFDQKRAFEIERGRSMIDQDERFRGPGVVESAEKIADRVIDGFQKAMLTIATGKPQSR